jgi:hypothetical protein
VVSLAADMVFEGADCAVKLDCRSHPTLGPDSPENDGPTRVVEEVGDHLRPKFSPSAPKRPRRSRRAPILIKFNAPLLTGEDPTVDLIVGLRRLAWFEVTPAQLLDRHVTGDWGCFAPTTSKGTSSHYKKAAGSCRICPREAHLHTRTRMPTAIKVSSTAHHSASEGDTIARARR